MTQSLRFATEVQQDLVENDLPGVVSTVNVPDALLVGEVEVELTIDSDNQGRIAAELTHSGETAMLVNRMGMDERQSSGNTKNSFDVLLDDDAPESEDIHNVPALSSVSTVGTYQPDGRGLIFGDGITSDHRDDMLFVLGGLNSSGDWDLHAADARAISTSENIFRRWALVVKNPCGPERYVGTAYEPAPGTGVDTITLGLGSVNLMVVASFGSGDALVDYRVELVDPSLPGNGTLVITDVAGNSTMIPINLAAGSGDENLPIVSGSTDQLALEFNGTASDDQAGDTGVADISLGPWSTNLQIISVDALPASTANFTVGLINGVENGRGYVRVTDDCGLRSYILVEIDASGPDCTGSVGNTKRYLSGDLPQAIPDNGGVTSTIIVPDIDIVDDVNVTLNITHGFDDDIDLTMTSPMNISLFNDVGSTGNDFIDTTLDDEAAAPIPDSASEAPFTDSYQPLGGPALFALDGVSAAGAYTLQVVDDKTNDTGTFDSWSVTIESSTFPDRYDGRAEDSEPLGTGICSIELLEPNDGSLVLNVDPFTPGDKIVRYSVELTFEGSSGSGTVRVTDCAGNFCDVPIALGSGPTIPAASEWGLVVLTLVLLAAGTVVFRRRMAATC